MGITDPSEEYFKDGLWGWNSTAGAWQKVGISAGKLQVESVPEAHAATHYEDATDELDVAALGSGAVSPATDGHVATADGAGGVDWEAPPAPGFYDAYVCVRDKKAQNTDGGTFTAAAWRTRDINDEQADTAGICDIASNQITLAAGTYRCLICVPAYAVDHRQTRLYNTTGAALVLLGTTGIAWDTYAVYQQSFSFIRGRFTIAAAQALEIQDYCSATKATDGFGRAANISDEIYTVAEFWREV